MEIFFAPVQGHTDAAYRHYHAKWYGENLTYYTPFIRLENNTLRPRDFKDWKSDLNMGLRLVPQIIFKDENELNRLVEILLNNEANEIDLNMGCPFPLQTGHGRGAATISNVPLIEKVKELVNTNPEINFSVKIRLGLLEKDEWKDIISIFNETKFKHITLHPRPARQQYGGEPDLEQFGQFLFISKNPLIYNGDIKNLSDLKNIIERFPNIKGLMLGRGILARPSLATEFINGKELDIDERLRLMIGFHNDLFNYYKTVLYGEKQVISKIQPFWEYSENEIGRKIWKTIKKASNLAKYQTGIAMIQNLQK